MRILLLLCCLRIALPMQASVMRANHPTNACARIERAAETKPAVKLKKLKSVPEKKPLDKLAIWAICVTGVPFLICLALLLIYDIVAMYISMLYLWPIFLIGITLGIIALARSRKRGRRRGTRLAWFAIFAPVLMFIIGAAGSKEE